jgi:hypothetical protein
MLTLVRRMISLRPYNKDIMWRIVDRNVSLKREQKKTRCA